MTKHFNAWHPVAGFGAFAGRSMATLDAIDMLSVDDKEALHSIMNRIAINATLLSARTPDEELSRDHAAVARKMSTAVAEFYLGDF